jgi:ring-1,2-phenylacetyl-CoA epoxidase subunit PaaC
VSDDLDLGPELRAALAELLLTMADDEFICGFRDSEWTGIAPMLEEDVAFSSLAQDEIGHAKALYELRSTLTGDDPDQVAYDRLPGGYRHCRLLDHSRGDWAFTITRRYLYDTADAIRVEALAGATWTPLATLLAKVQREEKYHQHHLDAWIERLARRGPEPRGRLEASLVALWPDALSPFAPLAGERTLIEAGILSRSMADLAWAFTTRLLAGFRRLEVTVPAPAPTAVGGRARHQVDESFRWLWSEFTSVRATETGATW